MKNLENLNLKTVLESLFNYSAGTFTNETNSGQYVVAFKSIEIKLQDIVDISINEIVRIDHFISGVDSVGIWFNDGIAYVEHVKLFDCLLTAIQFGIRNKQQCLYDFETGNTYKCSYTSDIHGNIYYQKY